MKKSVIAFGILFSVAFNTVSANVNPELRPIKVDRSTITNVSPLNLAVIEADMVAVKKFIAYGTDVDQVAKKGAKLTPLMYAARYNQVEVMKVLIAEGADVSATSKIGATALDYAKASGANGAHNYLSSL